MKRNHFLRSSFQNAMTLSLVTLLFCLFTSKQLNAQATISLWTYEPVQNTNANPTPNTGSGSSGLVGSMTGIGTATGMNTVSGCGSQTSSTTAWAIGTANPGATNESSGGQFNVSTVGHTNIIFQWEQRWSNTATNTVRVQYTTDGSSWNNFTMDALNTTFCLGSLNNGRFETNTTADQFRRIRVDFSAIPAVNNNANFGVRVVAAHYQATGQFRQVGNVASVATGGTWRFDNVTVLGTPSTPSVIVTPGAFNGAFGNVVVGNSSASSSYTVEGVNLTGNIIITPPAGGFEIRTGVNAFSTAAINLIPSSGNVPLTTIDVRFTPSAPGAVGGNITNASALATTVDVPVSGTGIALAFPTKLRVVSVNSGSPVLVDQPFSVQLESVDISDIPQNVASNTFVQLSINTGTGPLGGTTGGVITAGSNSLSIAGITYGTGETGVILDATAISGDVLTPASTNPFNVLDTAQQFTFNNVPASAIVNNTLTSFTVQARRPDNTIDINYTGSITISKGSGPGNMTGTLTKIANFGVATFNDIQFDQQGAYTIQADDGAIPTATSSNIFITGVPVLTELVVPKYFGSKTTASGNDNRTPVSMCLQIDNLIPLATYDVRAALALSSEANTVLGAGNIWNGSAFNLQDVPGAFTTDINGSSGPFWIHIQPTGNSTRFDAGQTHTVRLNFVPTGNTLNNTVKLAGSKILTALDIAPTARTVSAADDGAFIFGSADGCNNGKYILVYDNESGTGDPLFAYPAAITSQIQTSTNGAQLPAAINNFYQQLGVAAGDFVAVVPIGANNANGVRRVEARNADNTVANFSTDADGVWPSGANTTTNTRRSVTTLLNTDAPVVPSVVITGGEPFCAGGSATLDAGSGFSTYSWSTGATTQTISVNTAATFTVTVTDGNGCIGSASITTTIIPLPTATISGTTSICSGNSANLSINFTGSSPWTYSINGGTPATTSNNPETVNVTPGVTTSYTVTSVSSGICPGTTFGSASITVDPLPAVYAVTGDGNYCVGAPGVFVNLSGSETTMSYQLMNNTLPIGLPLPGTGNPLNFGLISTGGVYYVEAFNNSNPTCTSSMTGTATITFNALGFTFNVTGGGAYCSGGSGVSLGLSNSQSGYNYILILNGNDTISTTAGTNGVLDFGPQTLAGTYTVISVNSENSECSIAMNGTAAVTIIPLPTASISGVANICIGGSANLTLNFTGTAPWVYSINGAAPVSTSSNPETVSVSPVATTVYTITSLSDANCTGSGTGSATVTVTTTPPGNSVTMTSIPVDACVGSSVVITTNSVIGATGYTWAVPTGTLVNGQVGPVTTTVPNATITLGPVPANSSGWEICVFASNACGVTNNHCRPIRGVLSAPAPIAGANVACPNTNGNYSTLAVGGASGYVWSVTGDASVVGSGTSATVTFGPAFTSGSLCVRATLACGYQGPQRCLSITNSVGTIGVMSGTFTVCPGASGVAYSVPVVANATTYTWTVPSGATIATGLGTNAITVNFGPAYTVGNVCVTATSSCGVVSAPRCKTVASNKPGTPGNFTSGATSGVCGQTITYSVNTVAGATGYTWTAPAGASLATANGTNTIDITFSPGYTTGNVCVTADNGCGSSTPRCVLVKGTPSNPGVITGSNSVCAGDLGVPYSIAAVSGATGYVWTLPTGASFVSGQGTTSIIVDWGTNGGTIGVTATGTCGNSGTRTLGVAMNCRISASTLPGASVNAYPNPVSTQLNVELNAINGGTYTVELMDLAGRVIYTNVLLATEGINNSVIDVATYAKGVYTMRVKNSDGFAQQIRVVVE